jgi:hypothetical protein
MGAFLVLLESPWQVRFNRLYFTIFRAKVWKIFKFFFIFVGVDFVAGNSNKLQKLGLEGKISLSPQCVHTWFNGTGYISTSWNFKKKTPSEGMMDVVSTWIKIMMDFSLSSFIRWPHSLAFDDNHVDQPLNHKLPYPNQAPLCCCAQTILILLVNIIKKNVVS